MERFSADLALGLGWEAEVERSKATRQDHTQGVGEQVSDIKFLIDLSEANVLLFDHQIKKLQFLMRHD